MSNAIKIENLSKEYRLGVIGTGTLSQDLKRWWAGLLGKEDPTLKIGLENRLAEAGGEYVWALRGINLDVQQGEILGIIGKNGAGKSTLLKILSRVTSPTTGEIKMKGRVASLLEVGTGFHPELTGRENVFLNGAIMGMTKQEIKSRFDEIVDFGGVGKYIDTPVKRYSSGMYVRLAFAVAAHLEPEILIVDEVLAVGDAEFQKKALGKMQDVTRDKGRTILFVSHNMGAVKKICTRCVVMGNGEMKFNGDVDEGIRFYNARKQVGTSTIKEGMSIKSPVIEIENVLINGQESNTVEVKNEKVEISISGLLKDNIKIAVEAKLYDLDGVLLGMFTPAHMRGEIKSYSEGRFEISTQFSLPRLINKGEYILDLDLTIPNVEYLVQISNHIRLNVKGILGKTGTEFNYKKCGLIMLD